MATAKSSRPFAQCIVVIRRPLRARSSALPACSTTWSMPADLRACGVRSAVACRQHGRARSPPLANRGPIALEWIRTVDKARLVRLPGRLPQIRGRDVASRPRPTFADEGRGDAATAAEASRRAAPSRCQPSSEGLHDRVGRVPYAGASRIRFDGCFSAWDSRPVRPARGVSVAGRGPAVAAAPPPTRASAAPAPEQRWNPGRHEERCRSAPHRRGAEHRPGSDRPAG
jgi:hypothetical protein